MIGNLFDDDLACNDLHRRNDLLHRICVVKTALLEVLLQMFQANFFAHEGLATFPPAPRNVGTLVFRKALVQEVTREKHIVAEWRERVCRSTGAIGPHTH